MNSDVKLTFISKEKLACPLCKTQFQREELMTGSGRLIAGALTEELHRLYETSAKYGDVHPLVYQATVCPHCWFAAATDKDFTQFPADVKHRGIEDQQKRIDDARLIFPGVDFTKNRDLFAGAASQVLVVRSYDYFPKDFAPTFKQGIASLRAAWLFEELDRKYPGEHYDWLSILFKKKAQFFYDEAIIREQKGEEPISGVKNFGPDTDKNWAYEGALYLSALLKFKYGPRNNPELRAATLGEAKRTIARIFGLGKSSKSKPGPLLEKVRVVYAEINQELNESD